MDRYFAILAENVLPLEALREVQVGKNLWAYLATDEPSLLMAMLDLGEKVQRYLVLICDDQKAVRVAILRDGEHEQNFHYNTELYQRQEDGTLYDEDAGTLPADELESGPEDDYVCVKNAIDLALERAGLPFDYTSLPLQLAV